MPVTALAYFFQAGVLFPKETAKETALSHLNQKNTPTKPPSTPDQSKEYANQNTNYTIFLLLITCWNEYVNLTP